MRSSRSNPRSSGPDPLDPGAMGFAHRGLHGPGIPENSMAAFRAALDFGAGIECDVRLSADGVPLIFHDHDLQRLCASALAVEASSASVLMGQRLLSTNEHIPRLRELLTLVDGRVPLLIELKTRSGNAAKLAAAVLAELDGYAGPIGVMSFDSAVSRFLHRHAPNRKRGLVISRRASPLDRWRSIAVAKPDFLAVDVGVIARPWAIRQRVRRWLYSWTVRTAGERETAEIHADATIWEGDGRPGN